MNDSVGATSVASAAAAHSAVGRRQHTATSGAAETAVPHLPFAIEVEPGSLEAARWRDTAYRVFEFVFAAVALLLLLPVLIVVAIIVKLDSPGPPIFVHTRVGRSKIMSGAALAGRTDIAPPAGTFEAHKHYWVPSTIPFVKFRTMYHDAPERFPEFYHFEYPSREAFLSGFYKVGDDPRVTRAGRWLRRTTVDELPNFWCVLTGQTALVGPRPEGPQFLPYYSADEMRKFTVRTGITGLAQTRVRGNASIGDQLRLDLQYVAERSVALDLKLLAATIHGVIARRGAF
ncbi:N/A [soil metagenome]